MIPKHGELRGGDRWDRVAMAWVRADEWQVRQWAREDAAFARRANQGELCTPSIIQDSQGGVRGIQSMGDGKFYDSKSAMRAHYRRDGFVEVGNDSWLTRPAQTKRSTKAEIEPSVRKAIARVKQMPEEALHRWRPK